MKFVSFNVNSVRARLHQLSAVIEQHQPEVIGLQETKVSDEEFPLTEITEMGYHAVYHGQKTHYGVALLTKVAPLQSCKGFTSDTEDSQRRLVSVDIPTSAGTVTVINGYFPQGENREHPTKFPNKTAFYQDLQNRLETERSPDDHLVVMGDMNISPQDIDIGIGEDNRKRWLRTGKCSFLPEEREWLQKVYDWGLTDTFRYKHPDESQTFSWFDYRSRGFEREPKRGLRIDLILATQSLLETLVDAGVDYDIRGMEKPSDHAPIWAKFDLQSSL
ncbi:exodeoxyribonuclease III [Halioxenophilus aromaticivorans]|uniref:Exodeoxyribonuclease III n=1 Tax=Halioxenophilus aromaticivorans TaxID=1306992 RepID=A0AAV3TXB1_9ALTE